MTRESQNVEWKRSWRDEYLKWICGFANAQGGVLEIGRDDSGKVVGVEEVLRLLEEIPNKAQSLLGIVVDVNLKSERGREYIEVVVEPHPNPISYKGEYHYRSGSTKQVLGGAALSRFLLQRHGRTWDDVPLPGVGFRDLDDRTIDLFRRRAVESERLPPTVLEESLDRLVANLDLREGAYLKRAAVLLFHPSPHRLVQGASIKIGYFRGSEVLFHDVIEGSLFAQVDRTMDLLYSKYTRALISYDDIYRVETFPVPRWAMREAVINAVIHADYASPAPIQIRVYDDRVAIWNAAVLAPEWIADQVADELSSRPHNPLVANTFFRAGMIEAWGRGVQGIVDACRDSGNPTPTWRLEADGNGLWVRFPFSAGYQAADSTARVPATRTATPDTLPTTADSKGEPPEVSQKTTRKPPESPENRQKTARTLPGPPENNQNTAQKQPEPPETSQKTARTTRKPPEVSQKIADRIVAFLLDNPSASRREIAGTLDITEASVRYQLDRLKASGRLWRVGPDRGGRWEVTASHPPEVSQKTTRKPPGPPENRQKTARTQPESPENNQSTTRTPPDSPETSQKTARSTRKPPEVSQKTADRIVAFLLDNPTASRRKIAGTLDITEASVRYQLDSLKASGRLRRVGPDRGGRWEVAGQPPELSQKTDGDAGDQPEPVTLPDRILALLSQDPSAGRREIAARLGTTASLVRYRLDKLRAEGRIERVGPDKGGIWKVLDP